MTRLPLWREDPQDVRRRRDRWLSLYLSMVLILLTFFISLVASASWKAAKEAFFQKGYSDNLLFSEGHGKGALSLSNLGEGDEIPLIIERLKRAGLQKEGLERIVSLTELKGVGIRSGSRESSLEIPLREVFQAQGTGIDPKAYRALLPLANLSQEIPYRVSLEARAERGLPGDPWERAAQQAFEVYSFFLAQGVRSEKLSCTALSPLDKGSTLTVRFTREE